MPNASLISAMNSACFTCQFRIRLQIQSRGRASQSDSPVFSDSECKDFCPTLLRWSPPLSRMPDRQFFSGADVSPADGLAMCCEHEIDNVLIGRKIGYLSPSIPGYRKPSLTSEMNSACFHRVNAEDQLPNPVRYQHFRGGNRSFKPTRPGTVLLHVGCSHLLNGNPKQVRPWLGGFGSAAASTVLASCLASALGNTQGTLLDRNINGASSYPVIAFSQFRCTVRSTSDCHCDSQLCKGALQFGNRTLRPGESVLRSQRPPELRLRSANSGIDLLRFGSVEHLPSEDIVVAINIFNAGTHSVAVKPFVFLLSKSSGLYHRTYPLRHEISADRCLRAWGE